MIAADGVHSATREAHADAFRPRLTTHRCRYIWLAADFAFDAFRFEIAETEHGVMQLHAYPYRRAGAPPPSSSRCARRSGGRPASTAATSASRPSAAPRSSPTPSRGRPLRSNNSSLDRLPHGRQRPLVARQHGAARRRRAHRPLLHRLRHQARRRGRPGARRLPRGAARHCRRPWPRTRRSAARSSPPPSAPPAPAWRWFEELATYLDQPPRQFAFNLLTRSRRVTHDNLRLRDAGFVAAVERGVRLPARHAPDVHARSGCAG